MYFLYSTVAILILEMKNNQAHEWKVYYQRDNTDVQQVMQDFLNFDLW